MLALFSLLSNWDESKFATCCADLFDSVLWMKFELKESVSVAWSLLSCSKGREGSPNLFVAFSTQTAPRHLPDWNWIEESTPEMMMCCRHRKGNLMTIMLPLPNMFRRSFLLWHEFLHSDKTYAYSNLSMFQNVLTQIVLWEIQGCCGLISYI